jgi:hypothetical protein
MRTNAYPRFHFAFTKCVFQIREYNNELGGIFGM